MNIPETKDIKSLEDVKAFFKWVAETICEPNEFAFHPEDDWADYDFLKLPQDEIDQLNAATDMCWEICDAADEDLCAIAMEIYMDKGLLGSIGGAE